MSEKPNNDGSDTVCIDIPRAMYERVQVYCSTRGMTPDEFIFDAVTEKLASVHKERRRKQRL